MAGLDLDHEELMPENCENDPQLRQTESAAAAPEDGTAALSAGGEAHCTAAHQEMMDEKMQAIKEQLQYFLSKADEFETHVVYSSDRQQRDAFARVVPTFLQTCQSFFTYLESTARNSSPGRIPLPVYIRTRLLQFSEQLCSRLEQLLLMYASFGYISLEEADPLGILCTVPQGQYREIVRLGGEEPSSCFATECLLGVLLSQQPKQHQQLSN